MTKRIISIAFPYLITDWWTIRKPWLKNFPVVICAPSHGRMIITSVNMMAESENIHPGMVLADARTVISNLQVIDEQQQLENRLLKKIAEWCIRFTPVTAVDALDGILLDVTGCTHLWGGEQIYLDTIITKLKQRGYEVQAAIASTVGCAWAVARFGKQAMIIDNEKQLDALMPLPPQALRLDTESVERLHKLGFRKISNFIHLSRQVLFRRFGHNIIQRINQALGNEEEIIQPIKPATLYNERLPCLEPVSTAKAIEIAIETLVGKLCERLKSEQKGLRKAVFTCFRSDNKVEIIKIGTNGPSSNVKHLIKLLNEKISCIDPGPGIELFILEAPLVEKHFSLQNRFWQTGGGLYDRRVSELIDSLSMRISAAQIHRYLPDAHYWPEYSFKEASTLNEKTLVPWKIDNIRPVYLFSAPERIQVTAPIPDYPPMLFRHKGKLHKITKADGPERIEQEWWLQNGEHRDYYNVEDEEGCRYWIFRSGHYGEDKSAEWFLHGLFA